MTLMNGISRKAEMKSTCASSRRLCGKASTADTPRTTTCAGRRSEWNRQLH
ncbi:Uncharacterized protein DAT39_021590 [Clarias magur]|uniref:Uncharacterized protein n=1 Tax=Clarias magur TaxID=1594786 RepID=A0A8J4X047_CLAMG|nr:Uncharacterized protein DAT39_021590 [Clarias magur]